MMTKVIPPGSQVFDEPVSQMIKVSSRGLRGDDLRSFIKRAGHAAAEAFKNIKMADGEVPVHLIALGSTEHLGPNRNGDGFSEQACRSYHPTFVKHARAYRNHANKDPRKSYGLVKASFYHPDMHRIELVVGYNSNKETAEKNGGLVADEELAKLASGDDLAVSMACRVKEDRCSGCDNRAANRDAYCTGIDQGGSCKMGGLRDRITLIDKNGEQLFAHNDEPTFFDISKVHRPADRTAFAFGRFEKAASAVMSGAELAEVMGVSAPFELGCETPASAAMFKAASLLAEKETQPHINQGLAFSSEVREKLAWDDHNERLPRVFAALVKSQILMPVESFLAMTTGDTIKAAAVAESVKHCLPGIYGRMLSDNTLSSVEANPFSAYRGPTSQRLQAWVEKRAADYSLAPQHIARRQRLAVIRGVKAAAAREPGHIKLAGDAEGLARAYALYGLAVVQAAGDDAGRAAELTAAQNYYSL